MISELYDGDGFDHIEFRRVWFSRFKEKYGSIQSSRVDRTAAQNFERISISDAEYLAACHVHREKRNPNGLRGREYSN
jgi:hypothetical protein